MRNLTRILLTVSVLTTPILADTEDPDLDQHVLDRPVFRDEAACKDMAADAARALSKILGKPITARCVQGGRLSKGFHVVVDTTEAREIPFTLGSLWEGLKVEERTFKSHTFVIDAKTGQIDQGLRPGKERNLFVIQDPQTLEECEQTKKDLLTGKLVPSWNPYKPFAAHCQGHDDYRLVSWYACTLKVCPSISEVLPSLQHFD